MNVRNVWAAAASLALGIFAASGAKASLSGGPGLIAWAGNYNLESPEPHGGPGCINYPGTMPIGRQVPCGMPQVQRTATGRYTVTVENAAPFPASGDDTGYQVFVQAVGSNAHCFEEDTTWATGGVHMLTSKIRCVAPSSNSATNTDVDSEWAWSYRADSLLFPQKVNYIGNFAYARVDSSGSVVGDQTFNPNFGHLVTATRTQTGRYSVVFDELYEHAYDFGYYPDTGFLDNIVVQKTCQGDSAASCRRTVCIPYNWVPGHFFPTPTGNVLETTVEIRCYGPDGAARNTNFRVFAGEESHVSAQGELDIFSTGWQYGWMNYVSGSSNVCHDPYDYLSRAQHEAAADGSPGELMELCKTATGRYTINFLGFGQYHTDDLIPIFSSRATGGTYCNAHGIVCGNCGSNNGPSRINVRCYNRSGSAVNASWNMSMFY